ncbi:MAG TPA: trypsin-like peptidase domain-containing protein [Tepidisphaeraceae bacterium]|jgi:serine protease Do
MKYASSLCVLWAIGIATLPASADPPEGINLRKTVTVEVVRKTKDAVVNISTTKTVARRVSPFGGDDPFFWSPFDAGQTVQVPANSLGSGFIIHKEGYVVTNNHVIDRARKINVELADGRKLPADLISSDADADLAILKIAGSDKPFPALELGDSSDLMIGEPVIAVGNPMGFAHSVSTGIVSAIHRDLKDGRQHVLLADLIQTDAAINPGNSGGPLLNAYGQVIGINTAIRGDAQNIGFAIQVNKLRDLIPELMRPAAVNKVDVPLKLAERRKVTEPSTVTCEVYENHDGKPRVLQSINGLPCPTIVDACVALLKARSGQPIELGWDTGVERLTPRPVPLPDAIVQAKRRLGLVIQQMTPMLAEKYHMSVEDGLLVTEVARGSVAGRTGIEPGDVLVQLGRYRVETLDDFAGLLDHLPSTGRVRIGVMRGDQIMGGWLDLGGGG